MNYFIVNATTREIWAEWNPPKYTGKPNNEDDIADYLKRLRDYDTNFITRPHYPYSTELNWIDGQRVEEGVHFKLEQDCKDDSYPPYDSYCTHCRRSSGCDAPYIAMEIQPKTDSACLRKINGGKECKVLCEGCWQIYKKENAHDV